MHVISSGRLVGTPTKILCIGRNYAKHAAEMGVDAPEKPVVFLKPPSALIATGETIQLPPESADVHHEVELVVALANGGKHIPEEDALSYVAGYAIGLDLTARDIQAKAKKAGQPWSVAKGFDTFAPLGLFTDRNMVADPQALQLQLSINGNVRQQGSTADMIFPVARLIAYLSSIFTLEPGDLIYTGTPEGVGPVVDGDRLSAIATCLPELKVTARRLE